MLRRGYGPDEIKKYFILLSPDIVIRKTVGRNGVKILDSRHRSSISVGKYQGPIREQGGRTMVSQVQYQLSTSKVLGNRVSKIPKEKQGPIREQGGRTLVSVVTLLCVHPGQSDHT